MLIQMKNKKINKGVEGVYAVVFTAAHWFMSRACIVTMEKPLPLHMKQISDLVSVADT